MKPVYDIQVKENHNFLANGHVVHNCIFQEQIQQLAMELAGFSPEDSDRLRKAILKRTTKDAGKARTITDELHDKFVDGAEKNGYPRRMGEQLYEDLAAFAAYGFNKSHSYAYSYISYQCAWLLTYYPSEWLCAYAESMSNTPENRSRMMAELNALGYKIAPVDINNSGHQWTISDNGKVFYPGFSTIKGVGSIAVDEILANKPYVDATDLMWDENRDWKFHKFNKRALSALIRCCAFESMGIVGEGKTFSSYAHMHKILVDNTSLLKKKLKKIPDANYKEWLRLLDEKEDEWSIEERIKNLEELIGHFDVSMLIDDDMKEKLAKHNLRSLAEWNKNGLYWFVSRAAEQKTTKTGKTYCIIQGMDANAVAYKITCWNCDKEQIPRNKICIAKINKDDWGYKTDIANLRVVGS